MPIDQEILSLVLECLGFSVIAFGAAYFFAAIHLLSMDRKLPVTEFKDRQKSVIFLSLSIFCFLYVFLKYEATPDYDAFIHAAPAIGFFAFLGIGFAKFYVNYRDRVLEHKEKYEHKKAEKEKLREELKNKNKDKDENIEEIEAEPVKNDPLSEPVNFSKMRKTSTSS